MKPPLRADTLWAGRESFVCGLIAAALMFFSSPVAFAVSGTWLNTSGSWSDSTKWAGGVIADGAGSTVFGAAVTPSGTTRTMTVDSPRTIGGMNLNPNGADRVNRFSGSTITLSLLGATPPVILSLNGGVQVNTVIDGTEGVRTLAQNSGATAYVQFGAANIYSGDTQIGRDILRMGIADAIPHGAGKGNLVFTNVVNFGTLDLATFNTTINGLVSIGNGGTVNSSSAAGTTTLTVGDNNTTAYFGGVIANGASRTVALTKIGTGTQTLAGANTFAGATTVNAGELLAGAVNTFSPRSALTVGGGTVNIGNNNQAVHSLILNSGTVTGGTGALTATNTATGFTLNDGTVSAILDGGAAVPLIKTTTGTVTLSAANTYSGGSVVNAGVLLIANDGNLGNASGGITLGGGTLRVTGGGFSSARAIALTDNSTFDNASGGSATLTGGISKGGKNITFTGAGATTFIGTTPVSGSADVIVDGTTLQYDVAQTYNGPTVVRNGGALVLGANNVLPSSPRSALTLDDIGSGSSTLNGGGFNDAVLSLGGASSSTVSMAGGTLTIGGGSASFAGVISGTGSSLVKDSSGTQTLTGANTYDGGTTVSGGTLAAGAANTLPSGGNVAVSGGTLDIGANNQSVGAVTLSGGSIVGGAGVLTGTSYGVSSGSVSAVLGGSGVTLTKTGDGTVTLSGVNTYSGDTAINAGFLSGVVGGASANSAAIVADLATNGVSVTDNTLQWTFKAWTNATGGTEYLDFNFGNLTPSTTTAPLQVTDSFSIEGTLNILAHGTSFPDGTYPLVTNIGGTILGTVPGSTLNQIFSRTATTLAKSGDEKSILMTTVSAAPLTWQPPTGTWNTTDNNWKDKFAVTTAYIDSPTPDQVVFNDTPGADTTVTLDETVNPYSVTASNTSYGVTITGIGKIGGSGYLLKQGTGTLTLGNTNDFTGGSIIGGGEVVVSSGGNLAAASGAVTMTNGTLTLNNTAQTVASLAGDSGTIINLGSGHTLTVNATGASIHSGELAGVGALTKTGTGTLTLDGSSANTASGVTTVSDGLLALNKSGGNSVGGDLTISTTGIARLDAADQIADTAAVTVSGGTLDMQGFDDTVGSVVMTGSTITGSGGTVTAATYGLSGGTVSSSGKLGAGTLNSSGAVALNGTAAAGIVNISAGTLTLGASERLNDSAALNVTGGTLALGANNEAVGAVTLSGGGSITGSGGTLTGTSYDVQSGSASAILAGTGAALAKNTTGTVTLAGNNAYTGGVTVNAGELIVSSSAALAAQFGALTVNGGTLTLNNTAERVISLSGAAGAVNLASGHTLTVTQTVATTFSGAIGGAGLLNKSGSGTLTLDGANNYTGGTTLSAGVVELGSAGALGSSGTVNPVGATLKHTAANTTDYSSRFSTSSGRTYKVDTAGQNVTWATALTAGGTSTLTKEGTGTLTLPNFNTYSGTTFVNGGTVVVGDGAASGSISNSAVVLANSAVLIFDRSSAPSGWYYPNIGGTPTISGNGSVIRRGAALLRFNTANTYTGDTTVDAGSSWRSGNFASIPHGAGKGNLILNGELSLGQSVIVNGLSGNGNITQGGNVTAGTNNASSTFGGVFANSANPALIKQGTGTLTLTGVNTTTSAADVSAGTLQVDNIWAGSVTVASGATLSGSGTISNTVTLNGNVSPGASPGTLNTGSETWAGGGSYTWQINNATGAAGTDPGWDLLSITGGLDITAASTNKFTINLTSLTAGNVAGDMDGFNNTTDYLWVIAHVTETITNFDANSFAIVHSGVSNDMGIGTFVVITNFNTNICVAFRSNSAPVLTVPADQTIEVATTLTVTNTVADLDVPTAPTFSLLLPPSGMTINPATGVITWTPTKLQGPSVNTITVVASDDAPTPVSVTNTFMVTVVCPTMSLSTTSLPDGTWSDTYNTNVTATGGDGIFTYAITSGALPNGLTLNPANGDITGSLITPGSNFFTLTATYSTGCGVSSSYTVTVYCAAITLSPGSPLINAQKTSNYSQTISASGGAAPHTFAVTSGTLPNNMSLTSGGLLSGTPTNIGYYSFTVTATDTNSCTGAQAYNLTVLPALPDIVKPTVLITNVADKARVFTTPTNINGTAKDAPPATASGVYQVLYGVNGGPITGLASGTTNWSASVAMNPGTNTFRVKSVDLAGNSSLTNTRTYILSVTNTLLVSTNGYGNITPTTFIGSGTPTNGALLELNRAYTVEAKKDTNGPGVNYVFSNWLASVDGGPVFVASTSPKYTFLMQTNLSLTAVFETNRFIAAAGGYFGLFTDEATPIVSLERSGFFTFIPTRKQAFSGKLFLDGNALGYAGTLNLDGYGVSKPILRKGKATAFVTVQMTFDGSDSVSGTLYTTSNAPSPYVLYPTPFTSVLTGFKAEYNLTNNPATNLVGTYTMAVDVPTAPESPKGNSVANLTVKSNGMVTVDSMYLGDYAGLKPPFAAYLSKNGDWPLFAYTYKALMPYTVGIVPKTNKEFAGMIWGWMKFTNNTGINVIPGTNSGRELLDGYVDWIKYPNTNNFYPDGFTNHDLAVHGSAYLKPTNTLSIRVLNITDGNIEFVDGNLTSQMSNHFFMKTNSMIIFQVPNVNTQTCTIAYPSGKVTGKFTHPNDPLHPAHLFTGVILQDENIARGAFIGTNASGSFLLKSD